MYGLEEVVDFAEIHEYIDQPIRNYSTGMVSRLMFAAATATAPDLLVIDEVLSVGDAYFASKSFERVRELCDGQQSTLLVVSHDLNSAMRICDRMIWLDRGQIKFDGDPKTALGIYDEFVKYQEEQRLARRRLLSQQQNKPAIATEDVAYCRIRADEIVADPQFAVGSLCATWQGGRQRAVPIVESGESNWGEPETISGKSARRFLRYGSIFRQLPFLIRGNELAEKLNNDQLNIEGEFYSEQAHDISIILTHEKLNKNYCAEIKLAGNGWQTITAPFKLPSDTQFVPDSQHRYGTRRFEITQFSVLDAELNEAFVFQPLEKTTFRIKYRINDPNFDEKPILLIDFHKESSIRCHRFWYDDYRFSNETNEEGYIEIEADPLLLGPGNYTLTVTVFQEEYFEKSSSNKFFSANDGILDMYCRSNEITILENREHYLLNNVIYYHPAEWRLLELEAGKTPQAPITDR